MFPFAPLCYILFSVLEDQVVKIIINGCFLHYTSGRPGMLKVCSVVFLCGSNPSFTSQSFCYRLMSTSHCYDGDVPLGPNEWTFNYSLCLQLTN